MNTTTTYYVISSSYTGPNINEPQWVDYDHIGIYTAPAVGNMSGEPITEGWCGTTNDISVHAHGAYATIDEARGALLRTAGEVREVELADTDDGDAECVEIYRYGAYARADRETLNMFAAEIASSSDAPVEQMVTELIEALRGGDEPMTVSRDDARAAIERAVDWVQA